jgi:hypothetical protein
MLLVVLLKEILLLQVPKQHHDLVQNLLDIVLTETADALPQPVIHKQADVLRTAGAQVYEELERRVDNVLERLVVVEGLADDPAVPQATKLQRLLQLGLVQIPGPIRHRPRSGGLYTFHVISVLKLQH